MSVMIDLLPGGPPLSSGTRQGYARSSRLVSVRLKGTDDQVADGRLAVAKPLSTGIAPATYLCLHSRCYRLDLPAQVGHRCDQHKQDRRGDRIATFTLEQVKEGRAGHHNHKTRVRQ